MIQVTCEDVKLPNRFIYTIQRIAKRCLPSIKLQGLQGGRLSSKHLYKTQPLFFRNVKSRLIGKDEAIHCIEAILSMFVIELERILVSLPFTPSYLLRKLSPFVMYSRCFTRRIAIGRSGSL